MSFFNEVNKGKSSDVLILEIMENKASSLTVDARDFSEDQFKKLCHAIKESPMVSDIIISDIQNDADTEAFLCSVQKNKNIRKVIIQNTALGDKYTQMFADIYEHHPLLQDIFLKNAQVKDAGVKALAKAVLNKLEREIVAPRTDFSGDTLTKEVIMEKAKFLKSLRLTQNAITNTGALVLADLIKKTPKLQVFIIANNEIEDQGMFAIAEALAVSQTIEKIDVSGNPFSPSGAAALAAAVRGKKTLKECAGFEI